MLTIDGLFRIYSGMHIAGSKGGIQESEKRLIQTTLEHTYRWKFLVAGSHDTPRQG